MAITKRIRIMCRATSDNINQQFTLDLLHDPYWVGSAQPGCVGVANWSSDGSPAGTLPTGVVVIEGCNSATLAGTVVTINVPVMPNGYIHKITLDLLFA
jgi:hypothetical protein